MQVVINDSAGKRLDTVDVDRISELQAALRRLGATAVVFRSIVYGTIPPYGTAVDSEPVLVESLSQSDFERLKPSDPVDGFGSFCELLIRHT